MMYPDIERHIAETLVQVLRERLMELETLVAAGAATEGTIGSLAFVRKMQVRFDESWRFDGIASLSYRPATKAVA
jgi:hypothetical protein